jgi:GNAT superfamily N-acetyltransferase
MTQTFTIRPALLADAPRIALLSDMLGYPVAEEAMASRLQHLMGRVEDTVLVAALPSGQVVGWLHGSEQVLLESGRRCEILGLVVDEEHRTQGVGRQLVAAVEAWAASRELGLVTVRSNVQRAESHPFYEQLGYVRIKTQHAYRKELSNHSAG